MYYLRDTLSHREMLFHSITKVLCACVRTCIYAWLLAVVQAVHPLPPQVTVMTGCHRMTNTAEESPCAAALQGTLLVTHLSHPAHPH